MSTVNSFFFFQVVIDFHAQWCGPCKMIAPQVEQMDKDMADVVFLKVDVDEAEDVAQEYNITAMPTFIFIKNSAKVRLCTNKIFLAHA